jgi:hypothetical protein
VLGCLCYYWFRHKYCNNKEVFEQMMKFVYVETLACIAVFVDEALQYYFIYKQETKETVLIF